MKERWSTGGAGIAWNVAGDKNLPHEDHIEMSGRHVSVIVRYGVDADRRLHLTRQVIWPTLRMREGDVRGYLLRTYGPESDPTILLNGVPIEPGPVQLIQFYGMLRIVHEPNADGVGLDRRIFPSMDSPLVKEIWGFQYSFKWGDVPDVSLAFDSTKETVNGVYGAYCISRTMEGSGHEGNVPLCPSEIMLITRAECLDDPTIAHSQPYTLGKQWAGVPIDSDIRKRLDWRDKLDDRLILKTPDRAINRAFQLAKWRAAESLFETKMGLVHSPGGGRYYGGVWNNDQCEYSGPLFGYLGDPDARRAGLTAYRNFAAYMTHDYKAVPTSLEMEGTIPYHAGGDRGDAAMYASGAARFALSAGDLEIAEELYHSVSWCLEYCLRRINEAGVVESDCDELENRFPAGDANLSTACLYYDGLRRAADLARDLSRHEDAVEFDLQAVKLAEAIEKHFGAMVEGFETYRYYAGNTTLRAWICLPLAFGVGTDLPDVEYLPHLTTNPARRAGTLDALFSPRLWSEDGLATESGKPDFWDRSTLYALRGAFFAGDTERAVSHLVSYTRRRLLGEHVPYPVEAYPEGGQAHLSAESALYCRAIVEGMFGFVPTGLRSFRLTPRLPAAWKTMELRNVHAFGNKFDIKIARDPAGLDIKITSGKVTLFQQTIAPDSTATVTLPS